ncbi:MAG: tRNA-dihydrouridine synthase family protein [Oligoflexia bacterium]|nr:tRNA-dihydrouridine synthase family protein [Oligoflexia bacterium]
MTSDFPSPKTGHPALVLAPMEGVTDAPMRAFLTERGGFNYCVAEFLRINDQALPGKVFRKHIPELRTPGCATPAGIPVQIQLLGGNADALAEGALEAIRCGARAIDLNFGCPAPTVNRHDGGATLLKFPHRIEAIVRAVREAVPRSIPVSAKLRLGWDTMDAIHENAERAARGGANWITIHGRTRMQAYQPPAHWKPIGEVRRALGPEIPVIANGDIWTLEDLKRCREATGCQHFMLGRPALADPMLPLLAARELGLSSGPETLAPLPIEASVWQPLIRRFVDLSLAASDGAHGEGYTVARIKQWVRMSHKQRNLPWFDAVKTTKTLDEVYQVLSRH